MQKYLKQMILLTLSAIFFAAQADADRQASVATHGADVMPFSLPATTHIFTKSADGGTQPVIAKDATDAQQIEMIRGPMRHIQSQFQHGDFSGPSHIHVTDMPGLEKLKAAKPGQVEVIYRDTAKGAELIYRSADSALISALHEWFDSQVSDHGADAISGHMHHGEMQSR